MLHGCCFEAAITGSLIERSSHYFKRELGFVVETILDGFITAYVILTK